MGFPPVELREDDILVEGDDEQQQPSLGVAGQKAQPAYRN